MRVTKLYQNQKLLVWTRFSVPEFTEDYHVSFRARDAKSDVNQVKRTKCVYSSTLTKIVIRDAMASEA